MGSPSTGSCMGCAPRAWKDILTEGDGAEESRWRVGWDGAGGAGGCERA